MKLHDITFFETNPNLQTPGNRKWPHLHLRFDKVDGCPSISINGERTNNYGTPAITIHFWTESAFINFCSEAQWALEKYYRKKEERNATRNNQGE